MIDPVTIPATDIVDDIEWDLCEGSSTCSSGKKEIFAKFRDQKGETIGEASDDIYYDSPLDDFGVIINDGETETKNKQVKLKVTFKEETDVIVISDSFDMIDPVTIPATDIVDNVEWDLCKGVSTCPSGKKEVFVKFHDKEGIPIGEASDDIHYDDPLDDEGSIPFQTPPPFQGDWDLIPPASINDIVFVLVSEEAKKEIKELAEVFPKVKEKLKEVGVEEIDDLKVNDFKKLKEEKITLPNITEVIDPDNEEIIPAIPFEELNKEEKEKMPKDIIFVKAGGGKIDIDIDLKIDPNKNLRKEIAFTSGAKIGFYIKPKDKVKTIKGKIAFKPKTKDKEESSEFDYSDDDNDGIYTADIEISPVEGELEVLTEIDYQDDNLEDKEINITIIADPEGYVYEKQDDKEIPIPDAKISLYQLDQKTNQYELFPASEYEQDNPQTTDAAGQYSFIIPKGTYYLEAEAPGYFPYRSEPFDAKEGANINRAIELRKSGTETGGKIDKDKDSAVTFFWIIILLLLLLVLLIIKRLFRRDKDEDEDDNRSIV